MTSATSGVTSSTSASTTGAQTAAAAAAQNTVDYNSFLLLLIQELKNQDPTSPSDPTQFLSQIASFSNVQQTTQTNTKLDSLLTATSLSQAENVIGKTVSSSDGTTSGVVKSVSLGSGGVATATLDSGKTLQLDSTITVKGS